MVKIVEVDELPDGADDRDEECFEIHPAEFAKKVKLKETDDVVLVAAKGKIKLEVAEPDQDAVTRTLNGSGRAAACSRIRGSGVVAAHEFATPAGDSIDDPYEIDGDDPVLLQMEIVEDRFQPDKSPPEFGAGDHNRDAHRAAVTPYKIVVKAEPDDVDGVEGGGRDGCSHSNEKSSSEPGADDDKEGQSVRGDEDAVDVDNNGVGVVPDNLAAKLVAVDGDSVKGAEGDTYGQFLEITPKRRMSYEEDEDGFVIV